MAWHPVLGLGKEKACVEQAVIMTLVPPRMFCLLLVSANHASFFLAPPGITQCLILQGNGTNRMYLGSRYMHSHIHTQVYFKAFAHEIVQAGKSKICRVEAGNSGKS